MLCRGRRALGGVGRVFHRGLHSGHRETFAVPFGVHAADMEGIFKSWVREESPFWRAPRILGRETWFLPFWEFEGGVRVELLDRFGAVLQVEERALEGPSRLVYAGHQFPRLLVEVVKAETERAMHFDARLLDGVGAPVDVEPFAAFESTAFRVMREQVAEEESLLQSHLVAGASSVMVDFADMRSRRVLLPAHVVSYKHAGSAFRVFINGRSGAAYGIEQGSVVSDVMHLSRHLQNITSALNETIGPRGTMGIAAATLRLAASFLQRALVSPPVFLAALLATSLYAAWVRLRGRVTQQRTYEEWKAQVEQEKKAQKHLKDEQVFTGTGRRAWKASSSSSSSSSSWSSSSSSSSSWSSSSSSTSSSSSSSSSSSASSKKRPHPVDESDPYAVLGVSRGASKQELQAAFRRELMRYHPDHNQGDEWDKKALQDRTRIVIEAYQTLRKRHK